MTRLLTSTLAVLAFTAGVSGQTNTTPAVPLEPITAILDAFRTHDIVALGEGRHNNEQGYQFRLALIRDPRFAATVNDIVVESGSSTHQNAMDRFIRGESVPDNVLRLAWQDTTVPDGPWDIPMYEEFFKAVRVVNASLPADRKLRVLLGDPPFDWEHATREEAIRITVQRDPFAAELIQREVLARKRRALVIYGDGHFSRRPTLGGSSLVTRLEGMQARVLNIWTHTSGADLQTLQPGVNTCALFWTGFNPTALMQGAAPANSRLFASSTSGARIAARARSCTPSIISSAFPRARTRRPATGF